MNPFKLKHMSGKAFALWLAVICFVVQIPPLCMGAELCDSGFYLTFYDNIYSHPECVEYNFMYYLSGLTGGALLLIAHTALGMRIVGATVNVLCALCIAAAFPARRFRSAVTGTSLLMIVGSWWLPLTFSYDHLTSLLTCVGLLLILRSITASTPTAAVLLALGSGVVLGMNTFARIPNVLGFAYILLIPIGAAIYRRKHMWQSVTASFAAGWTAGVALVLAAMLALNHFSIFASNMSDLFGIASSADGEASHGISHLIRAQIDSYLIAGRVAAKLLAIGIMLWGTYRFVPHSRLIRSAAWIMAFCGMGYLVARTGSTYLLDALFLVGSIGSIISGSQRMRLAGWAGLAMLLIFPLGSDNGISNNGPAAMWMAGVPALVFYTRFLQRRTHLSRRHASLAVAVVVLLVLANCCRLAVRSGLYFDATAPSGCTMQLKSPLMRSILTSPERAHIIDATADGVQTIAPAGSEVLIYGSAPMLHYLTSTRPVLGNSWPEQLSTESLLRKLDLHLNGAPVIILKYNTIGNDFGTPSEAFMLGTEAETANIYHNAEKSGALLSYLHSKGYRCTKATALYNVYELPPSPAGAISQCAAGS